MADFAKAFQNELFDKEYSKSNEIDYFFTTRKTNVVKETIQKDLSRKKTKVACINNFIVLNLPIKNLNEDDNVIVEIWGDKGYFYQGTIFENKGIFPLISLKLRKDTQLFLKLIIKSKDEDKNDCNYINFITIPKRYQSEQEEEEVNV